ncbi:MAG: hypothetical protein M1816_001048 [Peltula sp. TS41687]|nr:MAG: hypothetical protein M1816_001048 [Peltula sp. TS41687]
MTARLSGMPHNPNIGSGMSLADIPKANHFTSKLPPDPLFPTPADSHHAPRQKLGPRMVNGALYTYVRPERQEEPELLAVSPRAMQDLGLKRGEEETELFREVVAGNRILGWDDEKGEGLYPWAQRYGGWQFGSWAGQLGDGRAISLFEIVNPSTTARYELQLKGAGRTPYSRFADGKAVLRSSIREFVVSEGMLPFDLCWFCIIEEADNEKTALNALGIPSTRALALTLLPHSRVRRERTEPGAIVARFAQSWLRIGTFDLLRSRGERGLIRRLATYLAEDVFGGWQTLPSRISTNETDEGSKKPSSGLSRDVVEGTGAQEENRFTRLYREIVRRNAITVAWWQAYGFMNGVLNTDNTSLFGLSIDFGPFAFLDNFDPNYTPNHDDYALRYSYRNQPTIIWWNLIRLGEDLAELIGMGAKVDDEEFVREGVREGVEDEVIERAETTIRRVGQEYQAVFLAEYNRLMTARLGLKTEKKSDFDELFSEMLDTMEALELDFNHFFRKLSSVRVEELETFDDRREVAGRFFHQEGMTGFGKNETNARNRVAEWLERWRSRIMEDWPQKEEEEKRIRAMKSVNPKFTPRQWILDELIQRVEEKGERDILRQVLNMSLNPFDVDEQGWGGDAKEEERFCGDVPHVKRAMQCSCSS